MCPAMTDLTIHLIVNASGNMVVGNDEYVGV